MKTSCNWQENSGELIYFTECPLSRLKRTLEPRKGVQKNDENWKIRGDLKGDHGRINVERSPTRAKRWQDKILGCRKKGREHEKQEPRRSSDLPLQLLPYKTELEIKCSPRIMMMWAEKNRVS